VNYQTLYKVYKIEKNFGPHPEFYPIFDKPYSKERRKDKQKRKKEKIKIELIENLIKNDRINLE